MFPYLYIIDIHIWDIVLELISIALGNIANPFELDHASFNSLSPMECYLTTGAVSYFLRKLYLFNFDIGILFYAHLENTNLAAVTADLWWVISKHFASIKEIRQNVKGIAVIGNA